VVINPEGDIVYVNGRTGKYLEPSSGKVNVNVIALTAHAFKTDAERCLTAGMDAYLSKPIQISKLIETVETVAEKAAPLPDADALQALVAQQRAAAPADAARPAFCLDDALASVAGVEDLFRQMVGLFFDEGPKQLAEIKAALEHGDAPAIVRAAHRLEGTVIYLGANPLLQALERLSQLSGPDDLPLAAGLTPELEGKIAALAQALASYQDAHRP
jgi:CheY-like chemotaxis protein